MTSRETLRLEWLDVARGIGIVLVVFGHAERGLVASGLAPSGWKYGLDFYLYTFHMPLFMFLAGLNVPHSMRAGPRAFLGRKLATVAWPYLLWSLLLGATGVLLSAFTNHRADWNDLWKIGWRPVSPFWFLYALFVYCLVVAMTGLRAVVLVPLAVVAFASGLRWRDDTLVQQLLHFLLFFVAGAFAAPRLLAMRSATGAPGAGWIAAAALAWFGVTTWVAVPSGHAYLSAWALPSAVLGIACVLLVARRSAGGARSVLVALGRASMPIYVMHVLATAGMRIFLDRLHLTDSTAVHLLAGTAAGVLGPYLAYRLLRRWGWLPIAGFGRQPAAAVPAGRWFSARGSRETS